MLGSVCHQPGKVATHQRAGVPTALGGRRTRRASCRHDGRRVRSGCPPRASGRLLTYPSGDWPCSPARSCRGRHVIRHGFRNTLRSRVRLLTITSFSRGRGVVTLRRRRPRPRAGRAARPSGWNHSSVMVMARSGQLSAPYVASSSPGATADSVVRAAAGFVERVHAGRDGGAPAVAAAEIVVDDGTRMGMSSLGSLVSMWGSAQADFQPPSTDMIMPLTLLASSPAREP